MPENGEIRRGSLEAMVKVGLSGGDKLEFFDLMAIYLRNGAR